jgi:hypothetical protein
MEAWGVLMARVFYCVGPSRGKNVCTQTKASKSTSKNHNAKTLVVDHNPDHDIWVSKETTSLSREQTSKINETKDSGGQQGDFTGYLHAMQDLGAVKSGAIVIDLNLSTRLTSQVRVNRIRIDSRCHAPLAGTLFYSPGAGPATPIGKIGFDLDSPAPTARQMTEGEDSQSFGADFFANKVQYLTKDDGYAYRIVARTSKHYCEFRLKIDASANGITETETVDDRGRPFQVSGLLCDPAAEIPCPKFSAYVRAYAGGVANPEGAGDWISKDPKSYEGS